MGQVHQIRLQGPWRVLPLKQIAGEEFDVQIPASWQSLFGQKAGTARFIRKFNLPTNLTSDHRLYIRLPEHCGEIQKTVVNKMELSAVRDDSLLFDVTEQLQTFNQLEVVLEVEPAQLPEDAGGLWQPVVLEIHDSKR